MFVQDVKKVREDVNLKIQELREDTNKEIATTQKDNASLNQKIDIFADVVKKKIQDVRSFESSNYSTIYQ